MMKITGLNKTYDRRSQNANHVLKDVSFTLPETGFVCILGPSGCGKTSLLNAIGGLDRFDSGIIETENVKVHSYGTKAYEAERNQSFGYIFQNYYLLQNHSVAYNVYLGLHSLDYSHSEKIARVKEALKAVDMERFIRRKVCDLSGGQQQRVAIARALARRPRVIFADEPTGNLDEANTLNICSLLRKISKTSLVVMVTHEQRIADFFADQIISLEDGKIVSNKESWQRESLKVEGTGALYSGDYADACLKTDSVDLRILNEEGAPPVSLTVLALRDRIVIKLDDQRAVTCNSAADTPIFIEGERPAMTIEALDEAKESFDFSSDPNRPAKAGKGLSFSMMLAQARKMTKDKGVRRLGTWFFMVVMTVLVVLTVGDYLTVSAVDPHEFIVTDSHMLEIRVERGKTLDVTTLNLTQMTNRYLDYYAEQGAEFTVVPHVSIVPQISADIYMQLDEQYIELTGYSYVPMEYFDESSLIMGRLPQDPTEIIIDRWVLDAVLAEDGILENSISDVSFFLGQTLSFPKKEYKATIVGISDCGEASMFMELSALSTVGVNGANVIALSEFKKMYPEYADLSLEASECLFLHGENKTTYSVGQTYTVKSVRNYTVRDVIELNSYAQLVVCDSEIPLIIRDTLTTRFHVYCEDKSALKKLIGSALPSELEGMLQIEAIDTYSDSYGKYYAASHLKADARTIVTVTIIVIAMVMLYLLRRSQVHSRIELLAVYRLLGIPKGKLAIIFALESLMSFLMSALPAAAITWVTVSALSGIEDLAFSMILPAGAVALSALAIFVYHLLVSLLPLHRLLRLPPASLAAKYDF